MNAQQPEQEPEVLCLGCGGLGEHDCEECETTGEIDGIICEACTGLGVEPCEDEGCVEGRIVTPRPNP